MNKSVIAIISVFVLIGIIYGSMWVSKNDYEIGLREQIVAKQEATKTNYDKTFKTIAQVAQVPEQFMEKSKEAFKEIYQPLIEGRYQDNEGNQQDVLMKWVQESNPQFDMAAAAPLYAKIQTVIEVQRNEFNNIQVQLIDMHRQHKTFCSTFMNNTVFFMGDRMIPKCDNVEIGAEVNKEDFCVQIITSTNTKETFKTGEENDIDLFN